MKKQIAMTVLTRVPLASLIILTCCLCHNLPFALAAPGSWTSKADTPELAAACAGCEVNGIFYVMGGSGGTTEPYPNLKSVWAYNPKTDSWTPRRDMLRERRFAPACAANGIIYVIGGNGIWDPPIELVDAYDPKTDTWTTKAPLSSPRYLVTACALDGIIYAIGGADSNGDRVATVEAYDPTTDRWAARANLPVAGYRGVASAVGGLIYAFFDRSVFAYDPKTNRWTAMAHIPAWTLASGGSASGVVNDVVYLFGGLSADDSTSYDLTLAYNPIQNSFTAKRLMPLTCEENAPCASARAYAACATIDGKIYIARGLNLHPLFGYRSMWMFDPQGGVTPKILRCSCESTDSLALMWRGEAGRLYGVQSKANLAGSWTDVMFCTGASSIMATNDLVEATCVVPTTDGMRFLRVFEAD